MRAFRRNGHCAKRCKCAEEVETALRDDNLFPTFLDGMYGNEPAKWDNDLKGVTRLRVITNYFTRMRFCTAEGKLDLKSKEGLDSAPPGYALVQHKDRKTKGLNIIFGHWAALEGLRSEPGISALDTGCVWGKPDPDERRQRRTPVLQMRRTRGMPRRQSPPATPPLDSVSARVRLRDQPSHRSPAMSEFKRIPPEQAQALREQGAVVVDVRDARLSPALHILARSTWTITPLPISSVQCRPRQTDSWWSAITATPARARPPT
jgi:diadenosine tetraphosphatase ApaH/serine/threonine PP2A family protein phosphatase